MMRIVADNPILSDDAKERRTGAIRGAMSLATQQDRLVRLFELMSDYRMRSLKRRLVRPRKVGLNKNRR